MKNRIRLIGLILILVVCVTFPKVAHGASRQNNIAATLDTTVYNNYTVEQIATDFTNNEKDSARAFKNSKVAIMGRVCSVDEEAKAIHLENPYSSLEIFCRFSDKVFDEYRSQISVNSFILVAGSVSKADSDLFSLKGSIVLKIDEESHAFISGKTDAAGTLYKAEELNKSIVNGVSYTSLSNWKTINPSWFRYYQMSETEGAVHFDLGDGECLDLYSLDWNKLVTAAKSVDTDREDWHIYLSDKEQVVDYLTSELAPGVAVLHGNIGSFKTNTLSFKYHVCTNRRSGAICAEEFFAKDSNRFITVTYYHNNDAKHAQEVAFFLGEIKVEH